MSFNVQVVAQTLVYSHHGILLSSKKEFATYTLNNLVDLGGIILSLKRLVSRYYMLCDYINRTFSSHCK